MIRSKVSNCNQYNIHITNRVNKMHRKRISPVNGDNNNISTTTNNNDNSNSNNGV